MFAVYALMRCARLTDDNAPPTLPLGAAGLKDPWVKHPSHPSEPEAQYTHPAVMGEREGHLVCPWCLGVPAPGV